MTEAPEHFDLVIIGSGSGNHIPDYLDDRRIAIVERDVFGGTCLNRGCIPSKMFVLPADKALEAGMKAAGSEYSGQMGFVDTEMAWPITHMVAPKEDAVQCVECHSQNSRLKDVPGLYIPGRDRFGWLDDAAAYRRTACFT